MNFTRFNQCEVKVLLSEMMSLWVGGMCVCSGELYPPFLIFFFKSIRARRYFDIIFCFFDLITGSGHLKRDNITKR